MAQAGQYTAADLQVTPPPQAAPQAAPPKQTGKYSVADLADTSAPLTPDQLQQLRTANANRSTFQKIFGLAPTDAQGSQLDQQSMESQKNAMASSPIVKQQLATAAIGTGIIGGAAAIPAAVDVGVPAAVAVGKFSLAHPVVTAAAVHIARQMGVPLPKILDLFAKMGGE